MRRMSSGGQPASTSLRRSRRSSPELASSTASAGDRPAASASLWRRHKISASSSAGSRSPSDMSSLDGHLVVADLRLQGREEPEDGVGERTDRPAEKRLPVTDPLA